jgi:preprotein translocase subunit SecA
MIIDKALAESLRHRHERELNGHMPIVAEIKAFRPAVTPLSDAQLRDKTAEFRQRLANGGNARRSACPKRSPSFAKPGRRVLQHAALRRAADRRHVLHRGKIAEMKTGEGKTLVATLPGLPQRARRQGRARRHRQRLPRPAATPSGWAASTASSA